MNNIKTKTYMVQQVSSDLEEQAAEELQKAGVHLAKAFTLLPEGHRFSKDIANLLRETATLAVILEDKEG